MTLFKESGRPSETLTLCEQEHRKSVYCTVLCLCHVSVSDILLFFYLGLGAGQLTRDKSTGLDICSKEYSNSDIFEGNEESRDGCKIEFFTYCRYKRFFLCKNLKEVLIFYSKSYKNSTRGKGRILC
jgi:hypothetical protein